MEGRQMGWTTTARKKRKKKKKKLVWPKRGFAVSSSTTAPNDQRS
jgi:hypothetical protein